MTRSLKEFRNPGLRALEDLDIGLPVTAGGREYIMLDKLYERMPSYVGNVLVGHKLIGHDMHVGVMMAHFTDNMTEEEVFDLGARRTINEHIDERKSTATMLSNARKFIRRYFPDRPFEITKPGAVYAAGAYQQSPAPVPGTARVRLQKLTGFSYQPYQQMDKLGEPLNDFTMFIAAEREMADGTWTPCQIALGKGDRERGFCYNPAFTDMVKQIDQDGQKNAVQPTASLG